MKPKIYNIVYLTKEGKSNKAQCSGVNLLQLIDELLNNGVISVYIIEKFSEKEIDIEKQEKS